MRALQFHFCLSIYNWACSISKTPVEIFCLEPSHLSLDIYVPHCLAVIDAPTAFQPVWKKLTPSLCRAHGDLKNRINKGHDSAREAAFMQE